MQISHPSARFMVGDSNPILKSSFMPSYQLYAPRIQQAKEAGNVNEEIQLISEALIKGRCPMTIRLAKEAQHSAKLISEGSSDGQNIYIKIASAATVGSLLTIPYHAIRAAISIGVSPASLTYAAGKGAFYGIPDSAKSEFDRICNEVVDLKNTLVTYPILLGKLIDPMTGAATIDSLSDAYVIGTDDSTVNAANEVCHKAFFKAYNNAVAQAYRDGAIGPRMVKDSAESEEVQDADSDDNSGYRYCEQKELEDDKSGNIYCKVKRSGDISVASEPEVIADNEIL